MSDVNRANTVVKGARFRAFGNLRPANQLFIEVQRVAKDQSWADVFVCNWATGWRKRQPLVDGALSYAEPYDWAQDDLDAQMADWEKAREAS